MIIDYFLLIIENLISNEKENFICYKHKMICSKYKSFFKIYIFHRDMSIDNIIFSKKKNDFFFINFDFFNKINDNHVFNALNKTKLKIFIIIEILFDEFYNFIYNFKLFF